MTTVTQRLLDLVIRSPRDPEVRSVYADALIQDGDPRGTFIMLQSHLDARISPDRREDARRQIDELLQANRERWTEHARWAEVRFKGGFIHAIRARAKDFVANGAALLAVEPVLEVNLTGGTNDDLEALAAMAAIERVAELKLLGTFGDAGAAALAKSAHVRGLTSLNLRGKSLGAAFASSAVNLRALQLLCLTGMSMGDGPVGVLAGAEHAGLERLYLARNELTDDGVSALAKSRGLPALAVLCLGGNEISDEGVAALAAAKGLGKLTTLELNATGVTDEGLAALAKSKTLGALKKVNVEQCPEVTPAGVTALRKAKLVVTR